MALGRWRDHAESQQEGKLPGGQANDELPQQQAPADLRRGGDVQTGTRA